jgi:hypothetical protein
VVEDRSEEAVQRLRLALVLEAMRFRGTHDPADLNLSEQRLEYVADLVSGCGLAAGGRWGGGRGWGPLHVWGWVKTGRGLGWDRMLLESPCPSRSCRGCVTPGHGVLRVCGTGLVPRVRDPAGDVEPGREPAKDPEGPRPWLPHVPEVPGPAVGPLSERHMHRVCTIVCKPHVAVKALKCCRL